MKPTSQSVLLGLVAILCWASIATLGNLLIHLPPFYVLGVTFLMGSVLSWGKPRELFPSWKVSSLGIAGYFGYHFFLFYSFRFAPAIEANLINYLWPMFMVLLTPVFFRGKELRYYNYVGAVLAAVGCALLVTSKGVDLKIENLRGYLLAFAAALSWPIYSLSKKKMGDVSLAAIGGFCLGAGVLCLLTHVLVEPRVVLQAKDAWLLAVMGIGPFGVAFYAWDLAMAKGDGRVIGALSYLTPVLSTLGLVIFTDQFLTPEATLAMVLIIVGASSGLMDFLPSKLKVK